MKSGDTYDPIRGFKRARWLIPQAAEEYQYDVYRPEPFVRLKNVTEIGFVLKHARGPLVLDAGAGTGRFTVPLRQKGIRTVPLDISASMLAHGRRHAERVGTEFPALVGDIERLPFKNGTFDTVVSITVLRHFPLWETILDEYLRVIRPGGRLIFDMGSGDQRAFLAGRGVELPDREGLGTRPLDYDAALTMSQLIELAQARNMRILTTFPADVFLSNDLLDHVLGDAAEAFRDHVAAHLHDDRALAFLDFMLRNFVRHLSPALSGSWLMVLGKSPPPRPYAPAYDAIRPGAAGEDAAARLLATLRSCCGPAFDARARQAQAYLDFPCNHQLLKMFREELAPWLPAEALTFRA